MKEFIKTLLREGLNSNNILNDFCKVKISEVNKVYNSISGFDLTDDDRLKYISRLEEINNDFDRKESSLINQPNFDEITYKANDCNELLYDKISNLISYLEGDGDINDVLFGDIDTINIG